MGSHIVKYNSVNEFCEEMKKDTLLIDRGIFRVTKLYTASRASPNIDHLSVVSTYSVECQIVKLEYYCGDIWGIQEQDEKRYKAAEEAISIISNTAAGLEGIEIRCGILLNLSHSGNQALVGLLSTSGGEGASFPLP